MGGNGVTKTESKNSWTLFFSHHFPLMSGTLLFSVHQNGKCSIYPFLQLFRTRVLYTHQGGHKTACIVSVLSKLYPSVKDGATYCIDLPRDLNTNFSPCLTPSYTGCNLVQQLFQNFCLTWKLWGMMFALKTIYLNLPNLLIYPGLTQFTGQEAARPTPSAAQSLASVAPGWMHVQL